MSSSVIFEDFSLGPIAKPTHGSASADPLEEYETGYKAGWDDAVSAHQDSKTHLSTVLAQNLEQVEFTLIEAKADLLSSLRPIFEEITSTLIPGLANTALRTLIADEIEALLKECAPEDVSILVCEQDEAPVAALLNSTRALSEISLQVKSTLSEGQAYVSCANKQSKIDVKKAIGDIQSTIAAFLNQPREERADAV